MANISTALKRELSLISKPKNARSYRAWLTGGKSTADAKQGTAAAEGRRREVGYGLSGEMLGRSSYADDGYAAYLRKAAKEARTQAAAAIEDERIQENRNTLAGYGKYLSELRAKDEETLAKTAEKLLGLKTGEDVTSEQLIATVDPTPQQARALRSIYRSNPATRESREKILEHLIRNYYSYEKAYSYCRAVGLSDEAARSLAELAAAERSSSVDRLEALFGQK